MNREIIAHVDAKAISVFLPSPVTLTVAAFFLLRPLYDWPKDAVEVGLWWGAFVTVVGGVITAAAKLRKIRANGGGAVWLEANAVHSLTWREPLGLAQIAQVRASHPTNVFGTDRSLFVVLKDGRVWEVEGRLLSTPLPEVAARLRDALDRSAGPSIPLS